MPDVLIYGDTMRSPELRHEIPLGIPDPFLYVERNGTRHAVVGSLELPRLEELGALQTHGLEPFGIDDLMERGVEREEALLVTFVRATKELGVASAAVPAAFPLELADRLRAEGVNLRVDRELFTARRRVKNEAELAGIRRAQRGTEAAMAAARDLLRRAEPRGDGLAVDGETLTSELLKERIMQVFAEHDLVGEEFIASHGPQTAIGHESGHGPIRPGEPVLIDLFPRDRESACIADMTRTYVVGEPSDELREYQRLCREALDRALDRIRPGVNGADLHRETCELFESNGYPTQLSKPRGEVLENGFFHALGHGVGLEVHEEPGLGRVGADLVAGDVVALEPGLYRAGYGGCRLEDLVLVTEDGCENLTSFDYELTP